MRKFHVRPEVEPIEMPRLPDHVAYQMAWMRELGYKPPRLDYDAARSAIEISYTRAEPLTWEVFQEAMDRLEQHRRCEPSPLVLPHWLPQPLRPLAEQWAREHGWDGVVYDEPLKTNPEV